MATIVSFFKITNQGRGFYFYFEKVVLYFFLTLLVVSLYALSHDSFFLPFVPELSEGLKAMAGIDSKSGHSSKKTAVDSLWLPTVQTQTVYAGDALFTESESSLVIKLNANAKLIIEPDSYLRLREIDGKPLIRLSKGIIKAEITDEQVIFIKKGAVIEKAILQKGTYFIKNDQTSGIQITAYDQNANLTQGKKEDSTPKSTASQTDENQDPESVKAKANNPANDPAQSEIEYDLPTPAQGTLFLVKNPKVIAVGAHAKCPNSCHLKIYLNQSSILEKTMKTNEPAVLKISQDQVAEGLYEWIFETETSQFKSDFTVKKYSDETLSDAISNGTPVEILY